MDRPELPRASRRSRDDGTPRPGRSRPGRLNRRRIPMNATVALRIERQDGAHGFDDPAVPGDWTIEAVTARAVPKLRYPKTDVGSASRCATRCSTTASSCRAIRPWAPPSRSGARACTSCTSMSTPAARPHRADAATRGVRLTLPVHAGGSTAEIELEPAHCERLFRAAAYVAIRDGDLRPGENVFA